MTYKVSVVIATHNGEKFIGDLLNSILAQSYQFHEIIISDDGSTDGTIEIVSSYMAIDSRIKIMRHDVKCRHLQFVHEYVKENFVFGFDRVSGDVIAPADQDDIWMPDKLERLVSHLSDDVDIVNAQDKILFENGETKNDVWTLSNLYNSIWYHELKGHTCIFKKELIKLFDHCGLVSWDFVLALYCCLTKRYVTLPDYLMLWRRHSDAVTFVPKRDVANFVEASSCKHVSKRCKIMFVNKRLICNIKHPSISDYLESRYNLIMYICKNYSVKEDDYVINYCCKVLKMCIKQTFFSFFMAGIYSVCALNGYLSYKKSSVKSIINLSFDAFARPYTFFYDQKDTVELF